MSGKISVSCQQEENCYSPFSEENYHQEEGDGKGCAPKPLKEERLIYLEEHPTKANGFYTRSLATKFGTIEDLSVPRVREGNFRPSCLPPYRRTSLDLEEVIIAMYAGGLSTRDISKFLESLYGTRSSFARISRLYLCP